MKKSVLTVFAAALLAGAAVPAYAADVLIEEPVEVTPVAVGGWYIRGNIGMSNQYFDKLTSDLYLNPDINEFVWLDEGGFAAAPIVSGGIGYQFNDYFRADATIEWRGKSDFSALDFVDWDGTEYNNEYSAKKSELVLMANGYYDIGTFYGVTPYVGAGIGASYNMISNFLDNNAQGGGGGYADDDGKWNLAWALHTGLGFKATERMTIDFGYSFISLGDAQTKELVNYAPGNTIPNDGVKFNDIYSHDFKIGIRYALN